MRRDGDGHRPERDPACRGEGDGAPATGAVHRWDARQLGSLGEQFDIVLDCGLFHVFDDEDRTPFVESLAQVVRPGGRYFMLCFSEDEPAGWGPGVSPGPTSARCS